MGRKLEFTKPVSSPCATQLMLWICRAPAASIWFEIWGVLDPDQNSFDFYRKISKKIDFFMQFHKKIRFSRQKLVIYSNFCENYTISIQRSLLSNILPVHDNMMIIKVYCFSRWPIAYPPRAET